MTIALGLLLPCLIYLALYPILMRRGPDARARLNLFSALGALVIALVSSVVVFTTLISAPHWPGSTQIAWTGVEEVTGKPLIIGGPREQALVAWPNESFTPSLRIEARGDALAALEVAGGGAFVLDEKRGAFLNGTPLPDGKSHEVSGFTIKVAESWRLWHQVDVIGDDGRTWASFYMPAALVKRERVTPMVALVDEDCDEEVRADAARMLKLERWAHDLTLLVTRGGELLLLGTEAKQSECELPCELSVFWPRRRLPITIKKEGVKLRMDFRPPRQFVSPLKPTPDGSWEKLVVTGNPLPGDRAFYLPLGQPVADQRQEMTFKNNTGGLPVFDLPGTVIGEGAGVPLPPHMQPATSDGSTEKNITSTLGVHFLPHSFHFATVNDLPNYRLAALLILFALFCYGVGLWVAYRRMPDDATRWVIYGLAAVLWNLLALRLLLAFRYALSPISLDALAVKGVTTAFLGLTVAPGLMLLFVRLRRDLHARPEGWQQRKRILGWTFVYFFLLAVFGMVVYSRAADIWANAPTRAVSRVDYVWYFIPLLAAAYLFLLIFSLYKVDATGSRPQKKVAKLFAWPLMVVENLGRVGERAWGWARAAKAWSWWKWLAALVVVGLFFLAVAVIALVIGFASRSVSRVVAVDTFVHDILMPFIFYWPLALILLGAKLAFEPGEKLTPIQRLYNSGALRRVMVRVFLVVAAAVAAAVFILPVGVRDAGSLMAVLAILIPTALVMLGSRPRRWGALVALSLFLCFVAVAIAFINVRSVSPILPSVAVSRILVFKNYDTLPSFLPFEGRGHLQKLRDGYQHTWENQAIAHEGGYTGMGFGYAPTRRSQVRQDTIQYDSVYSFFILSEFGLLGGAALALLYSVPLVLVVVGGRLRFDFGYAVATVVVSSFLFEALTHAGMNLNVFPFTGRDLPLLTVNSFTDLMRWAILFAVAAQAVLFRYRGADTLRGDADSLVTPPKEASASGGEPRRRYALAVALVGVVPAALFLYVVIAGVGVVRDRKLDDPFSWGGILDVVDSMARQGLIYVKEDMTIEVSKSIPVAPGMLIEQERLRFNALPLEERLGETELVKYRDRLATLASVAEYDAILDELRGQSRGGTSGRRVSLFKILPPLKWDDGRVVREIGGYRVAANRAFNSQLSFKTGFGEDEFPRTTFRDGNKVLIGPAWVMGRWVQLYNPAPAIPWTAHLSGALKGEWGRLGKEDAASTYGRLTLDERLQEAATGFAAEKGRALHEQLLRAGEAKEKNGWLPPRVAISVVGLPSGEALALGGWPRMTASRFWKKGPDGEWIPTYDWAEREAPHPLNLFYGGDRNFDQIVMGSATKPLWAAAVLKVHPGLDQKLQTTGSEAIESDVFGIRLVENPPDGWDTISTGWVNFKNYLSKSDNRYHVRLGFLGLAEKDGGDVTADAPSASNKESMRAGPPIAWKTSPKFSPDINFSHIQPGPFKRLHETPLAKHLLNMYGVGVTSNFFDRRLSFWTKNAADDRALPAGEEAAAAVFESISPAAIDLALDRVGVPRDYVTILLGGGSNLWANVDFAAAFATCVTGRPVLAHVVRNDRKAQFLPDREEFTDIAQILRPGLAAVVTEGTGTGNVQELRGALNDFQKRGYSVYAKTGTLAAQEGARTTSRIVLTIIKWENEAQGRVKTGVVFSIVGERAGVKTSTQWLGEFISKHRAEIERLLNEIATGQ